MHYFEDAINGIHAALNSGAPIVIGLPQSFFRKKVEELPYDKIRTKLYLLDSLKDFDYSLIK